MLGLERRTATVEMVSYRTSDIIATSHDFLRLFAQHSRAYGYYETKVYIKGVKDRIDNLEPKPFKLSMPGVDLYFSGVMPPMPRLEDGVFEPPDLGFAILPNDRTMDTVSGPARKSHLQQIADRVMADMQKSHWIVVQKNPNMLTFPNPIYGKIHTYKVPLLTPDNL